MCSKDDNKTKPICKKKLNKNITFNHNKHFYHQLDGQFSH